MTGAIAVAVAHQSGLEAFLQNLFIGLTNGTLIGLIALGYTMVYGIIELINFAHGDLVMLGCFLALTIVGVLGFDASLSGLPLVLAITGMLVACALFCGGLSIAADRFVYRPLRGAPKIMLLVTAIGVSFTFMNLGLFWGDLPLDVMGYTPAEQKSFPALVGVDDITAAGGFRVAPRDLLVWGLTVPVLIGLTLFVKRSRLGKAMRSVAQDPQASLLMGIDADRVIAWTFFIGGALGGVGSVVLATYNRRVDFLMGYIWGMRAFTAAVIGGIGNLPGAVVGGLVIGVVLAFASYWLSAAWADAVMYGILMLLLIFRPAGLLGSARREKV